MAGRDAKVEAFAKTLENEINISIRDADAAFSALHFREALMAGFFTLQAARDRYRKVCMSLTVPMDAALVKRFIEVQALLLCPICPHTCEHIWQLLGNSESIMTARWPEAGPVSEQQLAAGHYLEEVESELRKRISKAQSRKNMPSPQRGFTV